MGFILVFIVSCLCGVLLLSQNADAKAVVKTVGSEFHTVNLYDDHTVEANNIVGKVLPGNFNSYGELNINGETKVLDIVANYTYSLALFADGTVRGGGRLGAIYNALGEPVDNIVPTYPYDAISPSTNIIAISGRAVGYVVLYADGTVKVYEIKANSQGAYYLAEESFPLPEGITPEQIVAVADCCESVSYGTGLGYSLLLTEGNYIKIGSHYDCGIPNNWGYCHKHNQPPMVSFTSLPTDSTVFKTDNTINLSIKVVDPLGQEDNTLPTEFYLDLGKGFNKIEEFIVNGTPIVNGQLSAQNGTEYDISFNKTILIPNEIQNFIIKAVVVDSFDQRDEETVILNHLQKPTGLTSLSISSLTLTPVFNKNTLNYTASVSDRTASINVTANVDPGAQMYINGTMQTSGVAKTVPLSFGPNTITIDVKLAEVTIRTYKIIVTRNASNVYLSDIRTDIGSLAPNFSPNTTNYTVTLDTLEDTIGISTQPADAGASIKINGQAAGYNITVGVPIKAGNTTIPIVVTGWDGVTTKTYTITVTRPAGLSVLSTNIGTLSPSFNKKTFNYTVDVNYSVSTLNVMAILENTAISELYFEGVKYTSGLLKEYALTIGANLIQMDVKMGGITSTYRITVNRNEYKLPTISLYNPTTGLSLLEGHKVPKSDNAFTFGLEVKQVADLVENSLPTELYIGITDDVYQKVVDFTVNGVLNTKGDFLAHSGTKYTITLNKALLIPVYVNDFKIKVITQDSLGGEGVKELSLNHFTYILSDWSLDSIKDSIAYDFSGNCYNGIIQGAALTKGIVNYAYYFDGVDDYISIPKSCLNNLSDWSFEAWVKPEAPGYIYSEGNPLETMVIEMKDDNSLNVATFHEGRTENWQRFNTGANTLTRNEWNHIVITLANGSANSGIIKCYINGRFVMSGTLGSEYNPNSKYAAAIGGNIGIRSGKSLNPFKGCIDEVTLYGSALTESEVEKKYHEIVFLENIRITNRHNNESSHPCTFGTHFNKIEFELKKIVNELVLELDMPSNIKVVHVEKITKKITNNSTEIKNVNTRIENDKLILKHQDPFTPGDYCIEFLLSIDQQLIVKTKSYSDENRVTTNYESEEFEFEFMDF